VNQNYAREWEDLLEADDIDIDLLYAHAICAVAAQEATAAATKAPPGSEDPPGNSDDDEEVEEIDTSDPEDLYRSACKREAPGWWPTRLPRIALRLKIREQKLGPKTYPEQPFHPSGSDLGKKQFKSILKRICISIGIPFEGRIEIEIVRADDREWLGGWTGRVNIGGKTNEEPGDREVDYWRKRFDQSIADQRHMFNGAANVIHASAAAVNAMRGVNVAPPWMQGGEQGDEMPAWVGYGMEALAIAMRARDKGVAGAMQAPRPRIPHLNTAGTHHPAALRQLPGPTAYDLAGPPDEGYIDDASDGYGGDQGDYDGLYAMDSDLLEENFSDGGYDHVDYSDDNPLTGLSPDQAGEVISEYIEQQPDKDEMRRVGMSLVPKIMG